MERRDELKIDIPVGVPFYIEGVEVVMEERPDYGCVGCYFENKGTGETVCWNIACTPDERVDGRHVRMKATKGGEQCK